MILNYKGKMIDEVNRTEGDLQTTEDDQQTTEDDRGMTEDDRGMTEDDQGMKEDDQSEFEFECSGMMRTTYKGKMINEVNWTEGHLL